MADFFSHVLWSYVFFHSFSNWPVFAFFGVLLNLMFGVPAIAVMLSSKGNFHWRMPHEEASKVPGVARVKKVYWTGHSLVFTLVLALVAFIAAPYFVLPVLGGLLLHFALDALTHENSLSGQNRSIRL